MWLWITIAVVVVAVGALMPALAGRRSRGSGAEISARERYELLGNQVADLVTAPDSAPLRKARERWDTAGALLANARTVADFALVKQVADEGLAHVAQARVTDSGNG